MAVEKFSVSFEPDLGRALREAAEAEGISVSAWMAEAARQRLRNHTLRVVLDEIIEEQGWTWEDLVREADADDEAFEAGQRAPGAADRDRRSA